MCQKKTQIINKNSNPTFILYKKNSETGQNSGTIILFLTH
ncbi:hypothetical protein RC62_738 [Flavobacterium aquidurense]|uniref:Uncharacterized protein n=1 Tax=Flavobacterium aquidurense TaxID=362413 RepID=A0A0Q0XUX1_9FLAO|nr:hypothetical protein RC62_738 [Flavobacterium aquidurense]